MNEGDSDRAGVAVWQVVSLHPEGCLQLSSTVFKFFSLAVLESKIYMVSCSD